MGIAELYLFGLYRVQSPQISRVSAKQLGIYKTFNPATLHRKAIARDLEPFRDVRVVKANHAAANILAKRTPYVFQTSQTQAESIKQEQAWVNDRKKV